MTSSVLLSFVSLITFASLLSSTSASGSFQLKLINFQNSLGLLQSGQCCSGQGGLECYEQCATFFRICLKQYQSVVDPEPPCTYGSRITDVLGNNTINFASIADYQEPIYFPFTFAWPGTFSIIIEAWHNGSTEPLNSASPNHMISRMAQQRSLAISSEWTTDRTVDRQSSLEVQFRVVCEPDYFGAKCLDFCKSRDDSHGHYRCNTDGSKDCLSGWTGVNCDQAVCHADCHPDQGYCDKPGECLCRPGYNATSYCHKCERYPGCKHGSCQKPYECKCDEGWGGLFCSQDLNYCTHHKPCGNGATCTNTGAGYYTCTCLPGFTGTNCEQKIADCSLSPCLHGGSCKESGSNYTCTCPLGFSGRHCQISARTCRENPCENRGSCVDTHQGYLCFCPVGWEGSNCDIEKDECASDPCQNGGRCVDDFNSFTCVCPLGFGGLKCEINENDCSPQTCLNGGTCVDGVNSFKCDCPPGFMGTLCQVNIDECTKRPCANGGTCFDLSNDYKCYCRPGFAGKDCSININECAGNPCRNGGQCQDLINDYQCQCQGCFSGKQCEVPSDDRCKYEVTFPPSTTAKVVSTTTPSAYQRHLDEFGHPVMEAHSDDQKLIDTGLVISSVAVGACGAIMFSCCLGVIFWVIRRRIRAAKTCADLEANQNAANQAKVAAVNFKNNQLKASDYITNTVNQSITVQKPINSDYANDSKYGDYSRNNYASLHMAKTYGEPVKLMKEHHYAELIKGHSQTVENQVMSPTCHISFVLGEQKLSHVEPQKPVDNNSSDSSDCCCSSSDSSRTVAEEKLRGL